MVALEEHLPADVAAAVGLGPAALMGMSGALDDAGDARLQAMDAAGSTSRSSRLSPAPSRN
jgi:hypothetical protein